jgi:hypothetical protein
VHKITEQVWLTCKTSKTCKTCKVLDIKESSRIKS